MARFLLAMWPFSGHVHPNLAVAHALRQDGHEVAFYTGASARTMVQREGFHVFPFQRVAQRIAGLLDGHNGNRSADVDSAELYHRLTEHYTAAHDAGPFAAARQFKAMYLDWFLGTVPDQVSDLQTILDEWQPSVLVCDPFMWGPTLILSETQSVPIAVFSYFAGCLLPGPDAPPFALGLPAPRNTRTRLLAGAAHSVRDLFSRDIRRRADDVRRAYGLQPLSMPVLEWAGQMPLYLVASAPEFDYQRADLPPSVQYVGPCLWDKPGSEPPPSWLADLPQEPPIVYVSEGTAQVRDPILLRAAVRGLKDLPVQVIITIGRHREIADLALGSLAPNIRIEQWVSHSDLFPKASLAVVHGGSGTVLSALEAGLPLVITARQWDQLENAQRVVEAGVGLRLAPSQCTPDRLRAAVERVLSEPSFRQNARNLAANLARYGGPNRAAELLETLGEHRLAAIAS
jgi:MGT family glycosyltransferase